MLTELRRETQKHRDMTTANQREIAKLRRKEKTAIEASKRLERSNVIQRAMLKRRNEDVIKSQNKLKSVLGLLKRSSTPNKIFKSSLSPGHTRMNSREGRKRIFTNNAITEMFNNAPPSPSRIITESFRDMEATLDIRAQFKKQMVDKELEGCILCRRTQKKLAELTFTRTKLVGEQKELISERQRVVQAYYEISGIHDAETPQYMDERVQVIDVEINEIDSKMGHLEELLRRKKGVNETEQDLDLNWENALGLLKSLDRVELESTLTYFLEDLLALRVEKEDKICKDTEREGVITNLKRMVEVLRTAMLIYQQEEPERISKFIMEHERQSEISGDFVAKQQPWIAERPKGNSEAIQRQPSPSSMRTLPILEYASLAKKRSVEFNIEMESNDEDGERVSFGKGSRKEDVFGKNARKEEVLVKNVRKEDRERTRTSEDTGATTSHELPPLSLDGRQSPLRKNSISRKPIPADDFKNDKIEKEERKNNMGGSDVFQRLANAHTLASQAKVISRSSFVDDVVVDQ